MDSILLESPLGAKALPFFSPADPTFDSMLRESIDRFLIELRKDSSDFSGLRSVFFRLLQTSVDPPLEIIWFYSAVVHHEVSASKSSLLDRVLAARDLFQLLVSCSTSGRGSKSIALLAPVLSELYRCALEEVEEEKVAKKVRREIERLVEGILSYISICSREGSGDSDGSLLPCFVDLVRVWTAKHPHQCGGNGMGVFFSLVNGEVRDGLLRGGCSIGYLAGVVIAESFLLRLCLNIQAVSTLKKDLPKELRLCAISLVTVLRNRDFFEILLRLLLDPTLPVISLLSSKDESFVRDILYDALILVDYSFLNPGVEGEQSYDCLRSLLIKKLIITHEAVRIARAKGDHGKAISYINAFSACSLPANLIKWVTIHAGTQKLPKPDAVTPEILLKWLVDLEEQGLRLFEDSISKYRTKLIFDKSKVVCDELMSDPVVKITDEDLFFFDKHGEVAKEGPVDEEMEPIDAAFLSASRTMRSSASNGTKKRKEARGEDGATPVKYAKYKVRDATAKDYLKSSMLDGMSSGSEVENPLSDEEMNDLEH